MAPDIAVPSFAIVAIDAVKPYPISARRNGEGDTGADAKLRLMFNSVEYFVSDDLLFATLRVAVGGALGVERADDLLAEG